MVLSFEELKNIIAREILALHLDYIKNDLPDISNSESEILLEDICYHLDFLIHAIVLKKPSIYTNFTNWLTGLKSDESSTQIKLEDFFSYLEVVNEKYLGKLGPIKEYIDQAKSSIYELTCSRESYLSPENLYNKEVQIYLNFLLQKQRREANEYIHLLMLEGMALKEIYRYIFLVSQYEVGIRWQSGEISYNDEQFCTETTMLIMSGLYPLIKKFPRLNRRLVAATISNEKHNIGLRMVCDYFEMAGWDTVIISDHKDVQSLNESIGRHQADIIALSVALTKHINPTQELIRNLRTKEEFNATKIIIGGYALSLFPDLWRELGADGYGADAEEAVMIAELLLDNNYREAFN